MSEDGCPYDCVDGLLTGYGNIRGCATLGIAKKTFRFVRPDADEPDMGIYGDKCECWEEWRGDDALTRVWDAYIEDLSKPLSVKE